MANFSYTSSEYNFATRDPQNYKQYQAYKDAKTQEYIDAEVKARRAKTGKEPSAMSQDIIREQAELRAKTDATEKFKSQMQAAGALTVNTPTSSPVPADSYQNSQNQKKTASDKSAGNNNFEKAAAPSKKEQTRIDNRSLAKNTIENRNQDQDATGTDYTGYESAYIPTPPGDSNVPDKSPPPLPPPPPPSENERAQSVSPDTQQQNSSGVRPNPLNDYATTAYGISLHFMTIKQYNDVCVGGQKYSSSDQNVIAASGGRNNQELSRHPLFINDIYIDSMKMKVVTANNSRTRGTNAIDIELVIVEPIGMTFVQSLVALAKMNGIKTWDHVPFVLRIDFFGTLMDGSYADPMERNLTKFMCVKFIDLKINLSARGSEYTIRAIPQTHVSYMQSASTIPNNLEIYGKTVNDFFNGSSQYKIGLKQALDENQKKLVKNGNQKQADEFKFEVDDIFKDSEIFEKEFHNITNAAMKNRETKSASPKIDAGLFPINAGTNIKEVINQILKSSKYYKEQLDTAKSQDNGKSGIDIHIITTTVEYDENSWDDIRQQYKKTITYYVKKWTYFNTKDPQSPMSIPDENKVSKIYNYIYTGKNTEIINCKIDFNTHFFVALTSFEDKTVQDNIQQNQKRERTARDLRTQENAFMPLRIFPVPIQPNAQQMTDGKKRGVEINDFYNSVYTSAGDMLSVDLEILGDPDLIKQDDVFYPPSKNDSNSSLQFDYGQIFCNLNFRIPDDIDIESGLYNFRDETNYFSGTYQILIVDNNFVNGKFTQILKLVRVFENPSLKGQATDNSQDESERLSKRYPSPKPDSTKTTDSDDNKFIIQDVESGQVIYDSDAPSAKKVQKPSNASDRFTITDPESGNTIYDNDTVPQNDAKKSKDLRSVPLNKLPTKDATSADITAKKPEGKPGTGVSYTTSEYNFATRDPQNYKQYESYKNAKTQEYFDAEVKARRAKTGKEPSFMSQDIIREQAELRAKNDATQKFRAPMEAAGALQVNPTGQ